MIPTLIAQDQRRASELRHHQIRVAVSIDIRNYNRARLFQLDRIEVHILGDVGPAFACHVSQQSQFPSVARLPSRHQIQPPIIVVIERRNSPAALPA